MTLVFTIVGVLAYSVAHVVVSRHTPPPGWGLVSLAHDVTIPLCLSVAIAIPEFRISALAVASVLAMLIGGTSLIVAYFTRQALQNLHTDAAVGRSVFHRPGSWSVDLDTPIRDLQSRRRDTPAPHVVDTSTLVEH